MSRKLLRAGLNSRIAAGTAVGYYGQVVQLGIQLVSLPVFTAKWGLAGYGIWLILFTVPSTFALADLGLATAGGNVMTAAAARGDHARARAIYGSLRLTMLAIGLLIMAGTAAVLLAMPHLLDFARPLCGDRAFETAMLLACYGFLALANASPLAASRAIDAFASTGALFQTIVLAEAACAIAALLGGAGAFGVAAAFCGARLAGSIVLNLFVCARGAWLKGIPWQLDRAELRELIAPSLAALILPGAYAVTLQGAVVAIGAVSGPATIPLFTAVRTLSRTALQFAFRLSIASMPRFTVHHATGNKGAERSVLYLNLAVTAALVIPFALGILLLGLPVIAVWTRGAVHPGFALLAVMVLAMLFDAAWVPLSNLLLAINRHGGFTYFFLVSGGFAVLAGAGLEHLWPATGMAVAIAAHEAVMAVWVWRLAARVGLIDAGTLPATWQWAAGHLRGARQQWGVGR